MSTEGENIEVLVPTEQTREAWRNIQRWYQKAKRHPTPPNREVLEHTSTLREDLYRQHPPECTSIPILAQLEMIADGTPEGE